MREICILEINAITGNDIGRMARDGYDMDEIDTVNGLISFKR